MFQLPPNLEAESISGLRQNGIQVDYFYPSAADVAMETLATMQPQDSGVVPEIVMNVPQKKSGKMPDSELDAVETLLSVH